MQRMTIGEFARAVGLTAKALRLYDETGLLRPAEVDERTGYRYYRAAQLDRARLVSRLRVIGMPLDRIRALADLPAGTRAAEVLSYWRQVEADTASRQRMVGDLVVELRSEELTMSVDTIEPTVAARSGIGGRAHQQDALFTGRRLHAVADGFGRDSTTARRALDALATVDGATGSVDPVRLLDDAVDAAATAVSRLPSGVEDDVTGCTLTALFLGDGRAAIAHVGDSRAYLVRDGRLARLTRDHTHVQSLVDEGRLTEDEARAHAQRADLNRALVAGLSAAPDISVHAVLPGDRFVLTTDGVHAVLSKDQLSRLVVDGADPASVVAGIEGAVLAAGAPDNYAVVTVDLPGPTG